MNKEVFPERHFIMNLNKLKQQITNLVKASQDEVLLQDVVEMIYQNKLSEKEIYYRSRLEESIRQADAGMLIPASEVHIIARQWVTK